MRYRIALAALAFTGVFSTTVKAAESVTAPIINNAGKQIGTVAVEAASGGVLVTVQVSELKPGYHGMHFHEKGDCSDHAVFQASGPHVGHEKPHGFLHPEGPHAGNLPNLIVADNGSTTVELYSTLVNLGKEPDNLIDADGSALIIHENRDDHKTQPIGGSGARVACAVIKASK